MLCEEQLEEVTLELGGKSPLIVMPDADINQAIDAAHIGLFLNMGQCCCASSRLYVHEDIYDKFVDAAVKKAKAWKSGAQFDETSLHGPQVDKIQFDKVMDYIKKGKKEGATCLTGGKKATDTGFFVQPTVFGDVTDDMTIAKEEIFGPVMSILKFKDVKDAIKRANDTKFGLAAGVMTRDIGNALKISNSLKAGTVWINCYDSFDPAVPFGGFKESGIGREKSEYALMNYLEVKCVTMPIDPKF